MHLPFLITAATLSLHPTGLRAGGRSRNTQMLPPSLGASHIPSFPWAHLLGQCALGKGALSLPAGSFLRHLFEGGKDGSCAGDRGWS